MRRYKVSKYKTTRQKSFRIGYILLLVVVIFLASRFFLVINNNSERGSLPYVQLLNLSMPIVEVQAYDEGLYIENVLDLKEVVIETLGLKNISTYGIISNEVNFFKNIKIDRDFSIAENVNKPILPFFSPFELSEKSTVMVNEEGSVVFNETSEAYDSKLKLELEGLNKKILIHHTHSQEGYSEIGSEGNWNSFDNNLNIMGVGDVLTKELEEGYGISVIHDKTIHDIDYTKCYEQSYKTVEMYLQEYGDFDLIIDLHRNSATESMTTVNLNGEDLARIMFVTAQNSSRYIANIELAQQFTSIAEGLFPTLLSGIPILDRTSGIYGNNLGLSDNMILIELGTNENSVEEARRSTKYIARIIAEYLKDK
ncbi:MAG: stage II sporulation protein P [Clostridium sp.]|nr:stage II sporulation protein P [Clostridium sp.]